MKQITKLYVVFAAVFISLFLVNFTDAVSSGLRYLPGETLNPDCGPADPDCGVDLYQSSSSLSYATYTLIERSDPGASNAPQGPAPNWRRVGDSDATKIIEQIGTGVEKWTLQPGRYELTASLRLSEAQGNATYGWFNETRSESLGGSAFLHSEGHVGFREGSTNMITAIVEPREPTTYYIRQETGDINDDILVEGTWMTIKELPTNQVNFSKDWDFTGFKNFSTREQLTGRKWIDGKDIYRVVIDYPFAIERNSVNEVSHNIVNIDSILPETTVMVRDAKDDVFSMGSSWNVSLRYEVNREKVTVYSSSDEDFVNGFLAIIHYTK